MIFTAFILGVGIGMIVRFKPKSDSFKFNQIINNFFSKELNNKVDTFDNLVYSDDCSYLEDTNLEKSSELIGNREGFELWLICNKMLDEGLDPFSYEIQEVLDEGTYSLMSYCRNHLFGIKFVDNEPKPFYVIYSNSGKYDLDHIVVTDSIKRAMKGTYDNSVIKI